MRPARILGVVLAGGRSSRFGSDKAAALFAGRPLIEHAIAALVRHCDAVAVAGRDTELAIAVADRPAPGMGPLGGLAGALSHAADNGFDAVLSIPVDCAGLSAEAVAQLVPGPACLAACPVIGLWPVSALATLDALLAGRGSHAVRAFADAIGARMVDIAPPPNINTPADLAALETSHGL